MIYFILESKEKQKTVKEVLILILKSAMAWGIGYALTWVAKWIIVDITYHKDIIDNAINQMRYRGLDTNYSYLNTVWRNGTQWGEINLSLLSYLILYNITLIIYYTIKEKKNTKVLFYIIISMLPFVWYFVVRQHSYLHAIFTYRILYITGIANILILSEYLPSTKKKIEKKPTSIDKKQ